MVLKNPLIKGVQITPREITLPIARFLSKQEVEEYQESIRGKYSGKALQSLDVISFNESLREPEGSNFWALAQLTAMGIPVASISTLDRLAETNPDALRGYYEDSLALVLRSENDNYSKNNGVIKDLIPQLKKRSKGRSIKYPVLISQDITPVEGQTDYGLVARLGEQTKVYFNVGELAYANNHRKFNILDERGVPIFDENGTRTLYAKPSGLSKLNLNWYLDLYSSWNNLVYSVPDGRVVVEVGETKRKKLFK